MIALCLTAFLLLLGLWLGSLLLGLALGLGFVGIEMLTQLGRSLSRASLLAMRVFEYATHIPGEYLIPLLLALLPVVWILAGLLR